MRFAREPAESGGYGRGDGEAAVKMLALKLGRRDVAPYGLSLELCVLRALPSAPLPSRFGRLAPGSTLRVVWHMEALS